MRMRPLQHRHRARLPAFRFAAGCAIRLRIGASRVTVALLEPLPGRFAVGNSSRSRSGERGLDRQVPAASFPPDGHSSGRARVRQPTRATARVPRSWAGARRVRLDDKDALLMQSVVGATAARVGVHDTCPKLDPLHGSEPSTLRNPAQEGIEAMLAITLAIGLSIALVVGLLLPALLLQYWLRRVSVADRNVPPPVRPVCHEFQVEEPLPSSASW